jgi:hypothetical protein
VVSIVRDPSAPYPLAAPSSFWELLSGGSAPAVSPDVGHRSRCFSRRLYSAAAGGVVAFIGDLVGI